MDILRGLPQLTWLEIKIFLREPLGAIGSIAIPVLAFIVTGRVAVRATALPEAPTPAIGDFVRNSLPVFVTVLIAVNAVLSLVTIISIYREGGILKRLRATPLRPPTILTAHVLVKLLLTAVTMILMVLAGRRYFPANDSVNYVSFMLALLLSTWSILSVGFLIASLVPTARFAQPIGAIILYPMIALSGLFVPLSAFSPWLRVAAHALPLTYAVQLLQGIWLGESWASHMTDVIALVVFFTICTAVSSKVFRWE